MLNKKSLLCAAAVCLLFSNTSSFALDDSGAKTHWSYEGKTGPSHWAKLNPHFAVCSVGKSQSPLNISPKITDQTTKLELQYKATALNIVKDGLTSLMIGQEQTIINDGHSIQLNFPAEGVSETIRFNNEEFKLIQFHFHTPSENKLNGQSYPLEIHFVHQGKNGSLAVIGVLVKSGQENPALQKIIDNIPTGKNEAVEVKGESLSPAELLPTNLKHYDFMESLTTPPCAEGVQWVVMENSITASPSQISAIKAATNGYNARPIQSRNKREIFLSE